MYVLLTPQPRLLQPILPSYVCQKNPSSTSRLYIGFICGLATPAQDSSHPNQHQWATWSWTYLWGLGGKLRSAICLRDRAAIDTVDHEVRVDWRQLLPLRKVLGLQEISYVVWDDFRLVMQMLTLKTAFGEAHRTDKLKSCSYTFSNISLAK